MEAVSVLKDSRFLEVSAATLAPLDSRAGAQSRKVAFFIVEAASMSRKQLMRPAKTRKRN